MATKASVLRSYITLNNKKWTCNLCFKNNIDKPHQAVTPLRSYSFQGTSNIERHFAKYHNEVYINDLDALKEQNPKKTIIIPDRRESRVKVGFGVVTNQPTK